MAERKTSLTFEEKISVAFMHYVRQIDQQDLAMLYGVNGGRVNEACLTVKKALQPDVIDLSAQTLGKRGID